MKTTAIIPVAGEGTRLRPHTYSMPKVLMSVAGKPMISHILDSLVKAGVEDVVFVIGHMGAEVRDFVESRYEFNARFVEQPERKGLGHAIFIAKDLIPPGPLLIVLGDTLFRADLGKVLQSPTSLIAVKETDDPRRFGIVKLDGSKVVGIIEKPADPPSNLAVIGLYYLTDSRALFDCLHHIVSNDLKTKGEYQLTDALALLTERGEQLEVFTVDGWYDCGKKETLLQTNRELLDLEAKTVELDGSVVIQPVAIHPDATVKHSVVGPHVSVAGGVKITNSIVRDSILEEDSSVEDAVLEGSLVGRKCSIKGRARILNVGDSCETDLE